MTQWRNITGETEDGRLVTHVVPVDDLRAHSLTSECWCEPDLDEWYRVATHNSADNREAFERGERKAS